MTPLVNLVLCIMPGCATHTHTHTHLALSTALQNFGHKWNNVQQFLKGKWHHCRSKLHDIHTHTPIKTLPAGLYDMLLKLDPSLPNPAHTHTHTYMYIYVYNAFSICTPHAHVLKSSLIQHAKCMPLKVLHTHHQPWTLATPIQTDQWSAY